jgi:hypothetical protein
MAKAELFTHVLRHASTVQYRDGEIEKPVVKLNGLEVQVYHDTDSVFIAPVWDKIGMRPFQVSMSFKEAERLKECLEELLLS